MSRINNTSGFGRSGTLGLASGIDSESVIDNMMASMQNRIDKQKGIRQQILWKQNIYRDVTNDLLTLRRNFLNTLNPNTNLSSANFYASQTVHVSGTALRATSIVPNNPPLTIDAITQLATGKVIQSGERLTQELQVQVDLPKINNTHRLSFTLDGVARSVGLRGTHEAEVLTHLQSDLNRVFGIGIVVASDGRITTLNQRELSIRGSSDALAMLGLDKGVSNTIDLSTRLTDLPLRQPLLGNTFSFTINNIHFSFDEKATLNEIMTRINQSEAGVQMRYSNLSDRFLLTSQTLGSGVALDFSDEVGNLMGSLFGRDHLASIELTAPQRNPLRAVGESLDGFTGGDFRLLVDGREEIISIAEGTYDQASTLHALNEQLAAKFGADAIRVTYDGQHYSIASNRALSFTSTEGLNAILGFTSQNNVVQMDSTLVDGGLSGSLNINGSIIDLSGLRSFQDLSNQLALHGLTMSIEAGKLRFGSAENLIIAGESTVMRGLFGVEHVHFNAQLDTMTIEEGKNARFMIGGTLFERNTNHFNLNGYAVQLTSTSNNAISIRAENNVDAVVDSLQKFVSAYNAIIDKVNGLVRAKAEYRDFPPLSDKQKEAMNEKEIEQWEAKAKEGLVRNDMVLNSVLSELRTALTTSVTGSSLSLVQLGITSSNFADRGKLTIDETKLRNVLNTRTDEVQHLMTSNEGLIERFNRRLDGFVRSSFSNPGRLVSLAGLANTASATNNNLNDRITSIDATVQRLQMMFETQRARYWRQFSSLETAISQMNAQSSWLSQQLGQ